MFCNCLEKYASTKAEHRPVRIGINAAALPQMSLPAYVLAVAAVEALVNEICVAEHNWIFTRSSPFWRQNRRRRERMPIRDKLLTVPRVLYGKTFDENAQPYEDMVRLVEIRNELMHYKMRAVYPEEVRWLAGEGIALPYLGGDETVHAWPDLLSCTEGIRWAHATACRTAQELAGFIASKLGEQRVEPYVRCFREIPESAVREWYKSKGLDPDQQTPAENS